MIAARRLEHGAHGPVYERSFSGFRRDDEVEAALDSATRAGALVEFKLDGATLVTKRRWFESTPLDQLFRSADDAERRRLSGTVYSRLGQELNRLADAGVAHGAVHPANVLIANGLQLVDAVANTTRLGVPGAGVSGGWLWAATCPSRLHWADWDRANLLRMSTLLGLPAQLNVSGETPAAILARCQNWAVNAIDALPAGSETGRSIEQALLAAEQIVRTASAAPPPLLPRPGDSPTEAPTTRVILTKRPVAPDAPVVPPAPPPPSARPPPAASPTLTPPPAEIEDEIVRLIAEATFRGKGTLKMLRTHLEAQIVQTAGGRHVPEERAKKHLRDWLRRGGYVREAELVENARASVKAGTHYHVWVPRNVLMNAQRLFTHYGVAAHDADTLVAAVLAELGLSDEREGELKWHAHLEAYVQKNCPKKTFSPKQRAEMCAKVASFGVPPELAEQVTKRFLDEHGFVQKAGWFG